MLSLMQVTELAMLLMLPNWVLQWRVVKPMRYMVTGTMLVGRMHLCWQHVISLEPTVAADHTFYSILYQGTKSGMQI